MKRSLLLLPLVLALGACAYPAPYDDSPPAHGWHRGDHDRDRDQRHCYGDRDDCRRRSDDDGGYDGGSSR